MQACQCNSGYRFAGNQSLAVCLACMPGTYKFETSNSYFCSDCPLGTYATGLGSSVCTSCPAFSYTTTTRSTSLFSCQCLAGFAGPPDGDCVACKEGTFSTTLGLSACLQCPAGKYFSTPDVSSVASVDEYCRVCPASSWSGMGSLSVQNCTCNSGYLKQDRSDGYRSCVACNLGQYSRPGYQGCALCPVGKFSNVQGASSCTSCPIYQTTMTIGSIDLSDCVCECGYYAVPSDASGLQCVSCPSGKYKDVIGQSMADCLQCPSGVYSDAVGACSCTKKCPSNSNSDGVAAGAFCSCNAGFGAIYLSETDNFTCSPCPPGSYRLATDTNQLCTPCLAGYYNNRYLQTTCYACPVGKSTILEGSASESSCLCDRGYFCWNGTCNSCEPCPVGSYKSFVGQQNCTECEFPELSLDLVGQTSSDICGTPDVPTIGAATGGSFVFIQTCPPGQELINSDSTKCQLCPQGKYKPSEGNTYYDSYPCICCPGNTYQPQVGQVLAASCLVCPQGTVKASDVACGTSISDCLCNPGSYNVNYFPWCLQCQPGSYASGYGATVCELCNAGTYQSALGSDTCAPCPAGRNTWELVDGHETETDGASSIEACKCNSGYTANSLDSCLDCLPGTYRLNSASFSCVSCEVGKYSTAYAAVSNLTCSSCYQGATTLKRGANSSDLCTCQSGWYRSQSGYCLQCSPGNYKSSIGPQVCLPCEEGKYQEYPGSTSCTACPPNSFSFILENDDKSSCYCNAGYEYSEGECVGCDVGMYKDSFSNTELCLQCPSGTYTVHTNSTSAENCVTCPDNTRPQDFIDADTGESLGQSCVCLEGFYALDDECVPCPRGTYKDTIGDSPCTPCGSGFYNPNNGSTSAGLCRPCPDGTWTDGKLINPQAVSCICRPGFFADGDGVTCASCESGRYKTWSGSGPCTLCPVSTYSFSTVAGITACNLCPPNSVTVGIGQRSRIACLCAEGYSGWNGGPCFPCEPGEFKDTAGSDSCTPCPEGTFGVLSGMTSANECIKCLQHSTTLVVGQNSSSRCLCSEGYTSASSVTAAEDSSACIACPAGKFKNYAGDDPCDDCLSGVYSTSHGMTGDLCTFCPANSMSLGIGQVSPESCFCQSGYWNSDPYGTMVSCELCPFAKFYSEDTSSCISCPQGKYWFYNGSSFFCRSVSCPPHKILVGGDCLCRAGYYSTHYLSENCTSCSVGSFSSSAGSNACNLCEVGTYAPEATLSACLNCFYGSTTEQEGSDAADSCICAAGFEPSVAVCSPCPKGSYKPHYGSEKCISCPLGSYSDEEGSSVCTQCPLNSNTTTAKSTSATACQCDAGYYLQASGGECLPCPVSTFKQNRGSGVCVACPNNYTTASAASTSAAGCVKCDQVICNSVECSVGCVLCSTCEEFYQYKSQECGPDSDTVCSICGRCIAGQVPVVGCSATRNITCSCCATGTYAETGQTSCTLCEIGKYSSSECSTACSECALGTYQSETGMSKCNLCSIDKYQTYLGQTVGTTCFSCPPGSYLGVGAECFSCAPGKFQTGSSMYSSSDCSLCAPGTYQSAFAATSPKDCIACSGGTYQSLAGVSSVSDCLLCSAGKYSSGLGVSSDFSCQCCEGISVEDRSGMTSCTTCQLSYEPCSVWGYSAGP